MNELVKTQTCPYCEHEVEDCHAEWDEGEHEILCDSCKKIYSVEPIYTFEGFRVVKVCSVCRETEIECCCETEEKENV